MSGPAKTQAMRWLDARRIAYRALAYDPEAAFHSAKEAAAILGAPAEAVYKTLIALRDDAPARPLVVMTPATHELDLRLLAAAVGAKRVRMASQREAERLTGMRVGAITAIGLQRPVAAMLIDEHARSLARIFVSAGARGVELELALDDLLRATGAAFVRAT